MTSSAREPKTSALIVAVGLVAAAATFGAFFVSARRGLQTVQVVGAATTPFEADIVKWSVSLSRQVSLTGLRAGYSLIREDMVTFRDELAAAGIAEDGVLLQPVNVNQTYGQGGGIVGYQLRQSLSVTSDQLDAVEALALDPVGLLREGAVLQSSNLQYYYSDIATLKRELLAEATRDAQSRAQEIVGSVGGRLAGMASARAGVFQIREPLSTEVAGYGIHNTATREKEITVTVHSTFRTR